LALGLKAIKAEQIVRITYSWAINWYSWWKRWYHHLLGR